MYGVTLTKREYLTLQREIERLEKLAIKRADAGDDEGGHEASSDATRLGRDLRRCRFL